MADVAIKVEGVSKNFKITHGRSTTLKSHFVSFLKGKKSRTTEVQHALRDISFEINKGDFFGIVGRNGSGKSTLLKMLAGIYQPTQGKIHVQGKLVPFIELGVGFNPDLTGRENVYLNGALLGFSEAEVTAFYDEVVGFAELEQFMDKKLKNYSSGMQVRLAFSMAVQAKADVLLIDEVLAVGDADFQRKCFNYFKQLKKDKKTVVFVSHDMNAIREFCDKVILIETGKILSEGSPTKVADEYTKLFVEDSKNSSSEAKTARTGNGLATISNFKKTQVIVKKSEKIEIEFDVTANENLETVMAGFRLKTADDKHLFGTNNVISGKRVNELAQGKTVGFNFTFDNVLNSGVYYIDLAAEGAAGDVYDWIFDAVKIDVKTEKKTSYIIDPQTSLEITHED